MESTNINFDLKLLIDKKSDRVLFAEASKDAVDFIFSLLALPLGEITKLLTKDAMVGSIGEVYHSLTELDDDYIVSEAKVSSLLNPSVASSSIQNAHYYLPSGPYQYTGDRIFYFCYNSTNSDLHGMCCAYVSDVKDVICPCCKNRMNREIKFVRPKPRASAVAAGGEETGYVKGGVITYSIMDDLTVVPMSAISGITLLNKLQVKDLGSLGEETVTIGFKEGLKLLKASLQSKNVLTDVFLKSTPASN